MAAINCLRLAPFTLISGAGMTWVTTMTIEAALR